ncbi:MAG: hypothetical protein SF182_14975 [Deltaproteobacteria bacterium]|nr:hypothetical protein [Deltaproteobacteria bacterium]
MRTPHATTSRPAWVLVAAAAWLLRTAAVQAIPFATPTATPTNTVVVGDTATPTPLPATETPTQVNSPTATLAPTLPPVPTATISFRATSVKSGKSNTSDRLALARVVTASIALSGPSDTKVVCQTPATGDFVLTQICVSPIAAGGILVSAAKLGPVAQLGGAVRSCQSFNPGFLLPPSAAISCSTFATATPGPYFCMIAGLLTPS